MKIITRILAVIGGMVVAISVLGWISALSTDRTPKLAQQIVLTIDVADALNGDDRNLGVLNQLLPREDGVTAMVHALDRARRDERVLGLVARFGEVEPGLAAAQELRDAVKRFKDAGKFTVAYAASFGEAGNAVKSYYLASTFEQVWVQPVGFVGLNGLSFEAPFLRGLLDRYGIKPEFVTRRAYKTAMAHMTDKGLTPANREMVASLLDDLSDQMIAGIAENRGLPVEEADRLFGSGPHTAADALATRLIDKIAYQDELLEHIKQKAGEKARLTNLFDYAIASDDDLPAALKATRPDENKKIAVITLQGPIHMGDSVRLPRRQSAGSDTIAAAIAYAAENKKIGAIVLRIDSPGGSPAASETIRRAVTMAQQDKKHPKPVIVSMGSVAASGGYWVASGAKHIIAEPATLTGSIGVVVGKVSFEQLSRNLDINWDGLSRGSTANLLSPARGLNATERAKLENIADVIYGDFLQRVQESRNLEPAAAEALAQGRVWTGAQALQNGLVDELGGLDLAVRRAKEQMGLNAETPAYLVMLPKPPSRLQQLGELLKFYQRFGSLLPTWAEQVRAITAPGLIESDLTGF